MNGTDRREGPWNWPGDNDLTSLSERMMDAAREGQLQSGNIVRGFGNALWGDIKDVGQGIRNLVEAPGKVLSGELTPSMEPGPGLLSVPEYALNLATTAGGLASPRLLARGAAFDPTLVPSFFAWHGTGAKTPFARFERGQIGGPLGEAGSPYAWNDIGHGHGFYFGEMKGTGEYYARQQNGSLVRVEVEPDQYELFDLNGNLGQQSAQVRDRMRAAGLVPPPNVSGQTWYSGAVRGRMKFLGEGVHEAEANISKILEDAGVPGTKYLDQVSRKPGLAEELKTRNFVIFDPKHITIHSWDGRPLTPLAEGVNPFGEPMPEGFNPFERQ